MPVALSLAMAGDRPKADAANRETQRIMKQIKIPPPYRPVYQPPPRAQPPPPGRFTPEAPHPSPKVMAAELPLSPKVPVVEPTASVAETNPPKAAVTNAPAVDQTMKISAPEAPPEIHAVKAPKPAGQAPAPSKKDSDK